MKGSNILPSNFEPHERVNLEGKWVPFHKRLQSPTLVNIGDMKIPTLPIIPQLKDYKKLGRKKDKIRVKLIEEVFHRER